MGSGLTEVTLLTGHLTSLSPSARLCNGNNTKGGLEGAGPFKGSDGWEPGALSTQLYQEPPAGCGTKQSDSQLSKCGIYRSEKLLFPPRQESGPRDWDDASWRYVPYCLLRNNPSKRVIANPAGTALPAPA